MTNVFLKKSSSFGSSTVLNETALNVRGFRLTFLIERQILLIFQSPNQHAKGSIRQKWMKCCDCDEAGRR